MYCLVSGFMSNMWATFWEFVDMVEKNVFTFISTGNSFEGRCFFEREQKDILYKEKDVERIKSKWWKTQLKNESISKTFIITQTKISNWVRNVRKRWGTQQSQWTTMHLDLSVLLTQQIPMAISCNHLKIKSTQSALQGALHKSGLQSS